MLSGKPGAVHYDDQKAVNAAARYIHGNLRSYLVQSHRSSARLDKQVGELLDLEDSPDLLRVLAVVRALEAGNRQGLQASGQALGAIRAREARSGLLVVRAAKRQTPEDFNAESRPAVEERYQGLRKTYLGDAVARVKDHPAGVEGLAAVDAALAAIRAEFVDGFQAEDYARLEAVAEEERTALRAAILADAKARIDGLEASDNALMQASAIAAEASASLEADQRAEIGAYAAARQTEMAGALLGDAGMRVAETPETLDGLSELSAYAAERLALLEPFADPAVAREFERGGANRLNVIAEAALPEFEQRLAGLPATPQGILQVGQEWQAVASLSGLAPDLRARYKATATKRQQAMEEAIALAAAQAKEERQQRLFDRAKAAIDSQTPGSGGLHTILREVEAARRDGLAPGRMAALEAYAAQRRRTLADRMLEASSSSFAELPQSMEGLGRLNERIERTVGQTEGVASPEALARFKEDGIAAVSELAPKVLPEFESLLSAFGTDREGLDRANAVLERMQQWEYVEDDVRASYVAVATQRRDAIAGAIESAERERRTAIIAAGGDPEIAGHTFADAREVMSLEFVDERRVIFSAMGMRFGGTYEIVRDDVFVDGPNGTVVFAREGKTLSGMGMDLQRTD